MQEALRTYLELAMGLTEASRKKVKKAVKDVVGVSGATADQLKTMTSDLIAANSANRDALVKLVRFEVDRALGAVGLATAEEVADLTAHMRDLERQLAAAQALAGGSAVAGPAHLSLAHTCRWSRRRRGRGKAAVRKARKDAIPTADQLAAERAARVGRGPLNG